MKTLTRFALIALLVAVLAPFLFPAPAAAGPFESLPDGYRLAGVFRVTAARDTLFFSETVPTGGAISKALTPKSVKRALPGSAGTVTLPAQRVDAVVMGAKKPFRFRGFIANSMNTGTVAVPVDTSSTSLHLKYPCRLTLVAAFDSLRVWPATSDTVWIAALLKD